MAYCVVTFHPGGTKAQYDAEIAVVHPHGGASLPIGQLYHAAGPSPGGWSVVAIHDSKESWDNFLGNILLPTIRSQIKNGFTTEPQVIGFEIDHLQQSWLLFNGAFNRAFSLNIENEAEIEIWSTQAKPHALKAVIIASGFLIINRVGIVRSFSKPKHSFTYNFQPWSGSSVSRAENWKKWHAQRWVGKIACHALCSINGIMVTNIDQKKFSFIHDHFNDDKGISNWWKYFATHRAFLTSHADEVMDDVGWAREVPELLCIEILPQDDVLKTLQRAYFIAQ